MSPKCCSPHTSSLEANITWANEGTHLSGDLMFHCHFLYSLTRFCLYQSNYSHWSLAFVVLLSFHLLLVLTSWLFPIQIYIIWCLYIHVCITIGIFEKLALAQLFKIFHESYKFRNFNGLYATYISLSSIIYWLKNKSLSICNVN
jgi:hypothetical protein